MNLEKFMGCIMAIGAGDALGVPFETMTADEIENLELIGYTLDDYFYPSINPHPFPDIVGKPKGSWSDDTQLTLVTMESLIEGKDVNMDIFAHRHVEAYQNRDRRGWGRSTKRSCKRLTEGVHWSRSGEEEGSGNGIIMKIAPLALLQSVRRKNHFLFLKDCIDYARMTHRYPSAVVAGCIHAQALTMLLWKNTASIPENFLDMLLTATVFLEDYFYPHQEKVSEQLETLKGLQHTGELATASPKEISIHFGGGTKEAFAAHNSIATAYAAFFRNPYSFDCIFDCIRMGGDTDSNAAIAGSLLGASLGISVIPQKFIENLEQREYIQSRVEEFFNVCTKTK